MNDHKQWFRIVNKADTSTADVEILDEIGSWYGVTAKDFAAQLADLDVDDINLRINSPGGDVFDGLAIMNTLTRHRARVHADVIGIAASAASFVAVGGADDVHMSAGSMLMIHDAAGLVYGNADDMHETAALLDKISDNLAGIYARRAGGSVSKWRDAMRAETWYTAEAAVAAGLADKADTSAEPAEPTAALRRRVMASAEYQRVHTLAEARAAVAALNPTITDLPAEPGKGSTTTQQKEDIMSEILMTGLRDRLGILADAELTDEGILNALDEVLTAPPATEIPQAVLPDGVVPVDKAVYENMQAAIEAGRAAIAEATGRRRDSVLADALKAGRIAAASKDAWRAALDRDEDGTVALLSAMPENTVPVVMDGYTGGVDEAGDDDETTLYNKLYTTKKES